MDCLEAIRTRFSARAFTSKAVPESLLKDLFEAARWSPSGVNTQPWQVLIPSLAARQQIGDRIVAHRDAGIEPNPDYQYYPTEWQEPYSARRKACGLALYGALDIKKDDTEARKAQWYRNYYFFDAPIGVFFLIDRRLEKGSWLDCGMFIENVMIAAKGLGLDTCAQASMSEYPDIVREVCGLEDKWSVICGMAIGYADMTHPINQYRTERESYEAFVRKMD